MCSLQSSVTSAANMRDVHNVTPVSIPVSSVIDTANMRNVCNTAQYDSYGHYARLCMCVQYSPVSNSAFMHSTTRW